MINYPNGQKVTKASKEQKAHSKSNLGMQLEKDVIKSCDFYRTQGRAVIYKRPTPIRVYKMDKENRTHIVDAYFDEKSTTDFNGIYKGRYLDFECKETVQDTLSLAKIRPQQIAHLKQIIALGGIGFFLVRFKSVDECYLLDARHILECTDKKSFKRSFFIEHGLLVRPGFQPRLHILEAVDEMYFADELEKAI